MPRRGTTTSVRDSLLNAECEHLSAGRPADAVARKVHRESKGLDARKLVAVGGSGGRATPWQNGRVWSFGGCRPSLAQLNRTSPESLCLATRQTGLAFWLPSVAQVFKNASQSLGLRFVPSQGRHFGASMDRATKFRSLGEVKHRGGWKQDKSVARYEKGSRLGFGARQYPTMLTVHGDECEKHLEDILIHGRTIAPVVGVGRVQPHRGAMSQM